MEHKRTTTQSEVPKPHRVVRTEYEALKGLYGALAMIEVMTPKLERRLKLTRRTYSMMRSASTFLSNALKAAMETVPVEDRKKLKVDLDNTELYMRTRGAARYTVDDEDFIYLTRNEAMSLLKLVTMANCSLCDKRGQDIKRCKIKKLIDSTLNFAIPDTNGDECIWNGYGLEPQDAVQYAEHATWEDVEQL